LRFTNILAKGEIESPASRASVSGTVNFTGWALGDNGFKRLEVQIDGLFVGVANWGTPRPDIQSRFPEFGIGNSGFSASVNLDQQQLARGIHRVVLVGIDGKDTRRLVTAARSCTRPAAPAGTRSKRPRNRRSSARWDRSALPAGPRASIRQRRSTSTSTSAGSDRRPR
jgi:hypothetical protein